jgi:MFS family permease
MTSATVQAVQPTDVVPHTPRRRRSLAAATATLGLGLAANSLLGPLASGVIAYHYGPSMTYQGIGLDAVALVLAAPLALVAAVLTIGGHRAGPVLALAPAGFAAYMMPQYVVGPDYLGLPGNNQRAIPLDLALFVLSVAVLLMAWRSQSTQPAGTPRSDRVLRWVLVGVAAFIGLGRWLPALGDAMSDHPTAGSYLDNPTAFWLVAFLDLGIIVPAAVAAAAGLWRGATWARTAGWAVVGWVSLVPASVAAMAITMQLRHDPLTTIGNTLGLTGVGVVLTLAAAALYVPLLRAPRPR